MPESTLHVQSWAVTQPITSAKLRFFRTIAASIVHLRLDSPEQLDAKKKGAVTTMLAVPAPQLQTLSYHAGKADTSLLYGLVRLSQLQSLHLLVEWSPQTLRQICDWRCMTALQSLTVGPDLIFPPYPFV